MDADLKPQVNAYIAAVGTHACEQELAYGRAANG